MRGPTEVTRSCSTYIAKLHRTGFSEFRDGQISRLWLDEQLAKGHLLAPEHRPHVQNDLLSVTLRQKREKEKDSIFYNYAKLHIYLSENL